MAAIYNGEVKQHIFNSRVRNYSSNLEAAVDANNVSPQVYENLVKTVNANLDKFGEVILLINPISCDAAFGDNTALNMYNLIAGKTKKTTKYLAAVCIYVALGNVLFGCVMGET